MCNLSRLSFCISSRVYLILLVHYNVLGVTLTLPFLEIDHLSANILRFKVVRTSLVILLQDEQPSTRDSYRIFTSPSQRDLRAQTDSPLDRYSQCPLFLFRREWKNKYSLAGINLRGSG